MSSNAQFADDLNGIHIHPGLLDMATGASLYLTENYDQSTALYLPITYKIILAYRPMTARFFSFIRPRRSDSSFSKNSTHGEVITFDITLLDPESRVIAEIEGFAMRRIPGDLARSLFLNGGAHDTSASGGERLIEIPARPAIAPEEGVRALMRILQSRSPLAVVAVPQRLDQVDSGSRISRRTPPRTLRTACPADREQRKPRGHTHILVARVARRRAGRHR